MTHTATSKVENSVHVSSCQLKLVHGLQQKQSSNWLQNKRKIFYFFIFPEIWAVETVEDFLKAGSLFSLPGGGVHEKQ